MNELNHAINSAAQGVAQASAEVERLAVPADAARQHLELVRGRQADLASARQNLIARRAAGQGAVDDAADLGLIDADAGGLAALAAEAQGALAAAEGPLADAQRGLGHARELLRRAELAAEDAALTAHARHLERLLTETAARAAASATALGRPYSTWAPSPALVAALKKRALQAGIW